MTAAAVPLDRDSRDVLGDVLRRFADEVASGSGVHDDGGAARTGERWARIADFGWLALGLPDAVSGCGGLQDLALVLRTAGEARLRLPFVESLGYACGALLAQPASAQRDAMLADIAAGRLVIGWVGADTAVALHAGGDGTSADAAGTSAPVIGTNARVTGTNARLTGTVGYVHGCEGWNIGLVVARSYDGTPGVFTVDLSAPGVTCAARRSVDGGWYGTATFEAAPALLLAAGDDAWQAARRRAQLLAAAETCGVVQGAFTATSRYLANRSQFGRPIREFQAIQHRLVNAYLAERDLRALTDATIARYDQADPLSERDLWILRAQASASARAVAKEAIQLHGGMGVCVEAPVGDYYRRVLALDAEFGATDVALEHLAESRDQHTGT